jgi:uncharacterized protein (DUF885 family)
MPKTQNAFEGILDAWFERYLEDYPLFNVQFAGLPSGEGALGHLDPEFLARRERVRRKTLRALDQISPRELSNEQHLDRLALTSFILNESEDYERKRFERDPGAAEQIFSALTREMLRAEEEPARGARNIRALLKQAPGYLEGGALSLQQPERVWLAILDQMMEGADGLVQAVAQVLAANGASPRDAGLLAHCRSALADYHTHAHSLPPAPEGSYALGRLGLQRRIRDNLGLDYTVGQIESLAASEIRRISDCLTKACRRFSKRAAAPEIIARLRAEWCPREPLIELYRSETQRIAEGFRSAGVMTFPEGDELVVRQVPQFLQTIIATAAYDPPQALAKRQRGIFWVNDLGLSLTDPARQRTERQQHFGLPLTCAHEAYPGHHFQFVTANRHARRWRRLFAHAVFYEGWTLWCEQMFVDLKIHAAPWIEVQQLHDALWRCHRILVDCGLQTGTMSAAAAARHLRQHLGFTEARARAEVNWYTTQPAVPMSYWLGRLENDRLRGRLVQGRGWSLRRFNDWLISFGTLPQGWIERYGLD